MKQFLTMCLTLLFSFCNLNAYEDHLDDIYDDFSTWEEYDWGVEEYDQYEYAPNEPEKHLYFFKGDEYDPFDNEYDDSLLEEYNLNWAVAIKLQNH